MGLLQRLEMRQGQSLVMTPQLLQAIKLLQLSHLDLAAYVEAELERNPLLERRSRARAGRDPARRTSRTALEAGRALARRRTWSPSRAEIERDMDTSLDNVFPDETPVCVATGRSGDADVAPLTPSPWSGRRRATSRTTARISRRRSPARRASPSISSASSISRPRPAPTG